MTRRSARTTALVAATWLCGAAIADAQLRIVTYNTATGQSSNPTTGQTARTGMSDILSAIGQELVGGVSKPIDVLLLQEQYTMAKSAQSIVDLLNDLYDPVNRTMYARSNVNGATSDPQADAGRPGLVYNTHSVSLISELAFGTVGSSEAARQSLRYQLRPVGYGSEADFYAYNDHYKADTGSVNNDRRLFEATFVRNNADALNGGVDGAHVIYAGDYNIQSTSASMYQHLMSAGNGQAHDPLNQAGSFQSWTSSATYAGIHTQSPSTTTRFTGQTLGGVDDRFDFQLVSGEMLDNEGMSLLAGSYHTFGNNGSTFNLSTDDAANTYPFNGVSFTSFTRSQLLNDLSSVTDHLPVVADYQLPAKLGASLASSIPGSVGLGSSVALDVLVQNLASAVIPAGADELDYSINVTGDLLGSASGVDFALGGGNVHQIMLNTSAAGMRSGSIVVSTSSQGAANPMVTIPVSFFVGGSGPVRTTIARDDFDAPLNLASFNQTPAPGAFSSSASGFQEYQVGVSSAIPFALVDDSANGAPSDSQGVVNSAVKTDAWFGVVDTVNNDNPGGAAQAVWTFDVAGATGLEVSIDMGAMGDFETSNDSFNWTYSLDGGAFQPLFTSSVNEAGSAVYTLADGDSFSLDDPLSMTPAGGAAVQLSNVLQTLTTALAGAGDLLTIKLDASTDGQSEAYVFDNIIVTGLVSAYDPADFDQDGDVDADDLAIWKTGFGAGAAGDANGDSATDGADFLIWQRDYTGPGGVVAAVPEPAGLALILVATLAAATTRRRA